MEKSFNKILQEVYSCYGWPKMNFERNWNYVSVIWKVFNKWATLKIKNSVITIHPEDIKPSGQVKHNLLWNKDIAVIPYIKNMAFQEQEMHQYLLFNINSNLLFSYRSYFRNANPNNYHSYQKIWLKPASSILFFLNSFQLKLKDFPYKFEKALRTNFSK